MTYIHQDWPSWRYGPNGAAEIFENAKDVPAGWVDHPSKIGQEEAVPKRRGRPPKAENFSEDDF